ncbi:MAG: tetratricopeptide repeat protein [Bryobacteraceae bacterium]
MQTDSNKEGTKWVAALMLVVIAASGLAMYWSVRLISANWFGQRASASASVHAVALAPGNEEYLRKAAELTEEAGGDGTAYYRKAVIVKPYAASDWVQLGFHAEREGRYGEAERDLLKAARVDQSFEPRWTLANFYFRRGATKNALRWIQKALYIGEGDLTPVFRLCWQATTDPGQILRDAMPNRPAALGQYLEFLFSTNRSDEATPIAMRLVGIADRDRIAALLDYCDSALAAGHPDEAVIVWDALSGRGLIPHPTVGGNSAHVTRNSNFRASLTGLGFDWKPSAPGGVLVDSEGAEGLRIQFSGKQADQAVILSQYVHLSPGTRYVLRVRYQSEGIPPGTGLRWRVLDPFTGRDVERASLDLVSAHTKEEHAEFVAPSELRWGLLQLLYNRRPGTERLEGSLQLISVDIDASR